MYKDYRVIKAGENEFYRYGRKAQEKLAAWANPNEKGFVNVPADGGKYWTIGTSKGKFGEFAKIGETIFSVNTAGYVWAKAGTEKGDALIRAINEFVTAMANRNAERSEDLEDEEAE